ncbi:hypothetical protein [Amycolatopsis minnesotensis]|uniref:Uncharacterized protein n=1 Tax=Amycolatopsis minnesotensis TaxID=337894 RepID=A0ABN2SS12_9PSEU
MVLVVDQMHEVLLGLAGRVPDEFLASARGRLADGAAEEVAAVVTHELAGLGQPMTTAQAAVLAELVSGSDARVFTAVPIVDEEPAPVWSFTRNGEPRDCGTTTDALVESLAATPAARGLWLAWRTPLGGGEAPVPVYVVTTDGSDLLDLPDLPGLAAALQRALAGQPGVPRIEVVGPGEVPGYQRAARAYGTLVWASTEPPELFVARVFDRIDPDRGPLFDDDHARISDPGERARVLVYLRAGEPLMSTDAALVDVVEPRRGQVVPTSYRTDGVWLWPDAVTYYLEQYGLAPDEGLLEHIRTAGQVPEKPDAVGLDRALRHLLDLSA